ncbi:MAG: penicillin-binding protein 1C [Verrucomicrobia bacterium]|nr:penicillin-binding protein 1C [Verrucomicrobiota bacterium]
MKTRLRKLCRRAALVLVLGFIALEIALRLTPLPAGLQSAPPASTEFLDRHGRSLRTLLVDDRRFSRQCDLTDVSPPLVAATLGAEDARFRSHPGVDPLAICRAVRDAARRTVPTSGASTITQQLVKLAQPVPRTFCNKVREMWLALAVEHRWSKDRILTEYLNRLDYGDLQTGIAAATWHYLGKPPSDLSAAEAALLAALPKAPTRLNPHDDFAAARARQQWVLGRMLAGGSLDAAALARAIDEPLRLRPRAHEFEAPHFVNLLLTRRGLVPSGGGPVHTTLDLDLNRFAERTLAENLQRLIDKHATSGAVVVIDNRSGEVLALAGSGETNGAWMSRSSGSTIKPFTYLLALENGAQPCTVVPDVPTTFATPTGSYRPNNYNHRFHGPVTLRFALGNSLNVAAIRTLELAGGPPALHRALREVGITTLDHPADYYGLGLTLGNGEVRLLELANAFATLGRLGMHRPYRLLGNTGFPPVREDSASRLSATEPTGLQPIAPDRQDAYPPARRVFDAGAAFLLADMLSDNAARAASFGLRSWLTFDFPVACKTGTSSDYRDNWTVGYTPEFTVAVWVGNPDGTPMRDITGVTGAAPVMHDLIEHLHARFGTSWFAQPPQVDTFKTDPLTGRLAPADRRGTIDEKCLQPPEPARPDDYDATSRVRLPAEYGPWLASSQNSLGTLVTLATSAPELRIIQPAPGSIYYLDGDLPPDSQWIPLRAEAGGEVSWSCASLPIKTTAAGPRMQIREGRHVILAADAATGVQASTWIEVKPW